MNDKDKVAAAPPEPPYGMDEDAEKRWHKNHRIMRVTVPTCRLCAPPEPPRPDQSEDYKRGFAQGWWRRAMAGGVAAPEGLSLDVERLRLAIDTALDAYGVEGVAAEYDRLSPSSGESGSPGEPE